MLDLIVVLVIVLIVIAAVAFLAIPRRRQLPGRRGGGPVGAGRRQRTGRGHPREASERVLLAEGEQIQQHVEDRLAARGVPPHRLSGPNPPTAAERVAPHVPADPAHTPYPASAPIVAPGASPYDPYDPRRPYAQSPLTDTAPPNGRAPVFDPNGGAPIHNAPGGFPPEGAYPGAVSPQGAYPGALDPDGYPVVPADGDYPGVVPPEGAYPGPDPLAGGDPDYPQPRPFGGRRRRGIGSRWTPPGFGR